MINVYLSGCMSHHYKNEKPNLAEIWRDDAEENLFKYDYKIFNPCANYKQNRQYDSKSMIYQKITYLEKCDVIIVNLDYLEKSVGTMFDLFWAYFNHKPVVAFCDTDIVNEELINQQYIKEAITVRFDTLYEACEYIKNMYSQLIY